MAASLLAAHALYWILPNVVEPWNAQLIDQLFVLRSSIPSLRPAYDSVVVHVDLSDRSLQSIGTFYLTREHFARVIRNLSEMDVAVQAWDLIFAAPSSRTDDSSLLEATANAHNVLYGAAFRLFAKGQKSPPVDRSLGQSYLQQTAWHVKVEGSANDFYRGARPTPTFPELARTSAGLGYLSITADRDGVYRKLPLLIQFGDAMYPSLALKTACTYLNVTPDRVVVRPGTGITLLHAKDPGGSERDITIPIDDQGNMVINFIGPWGTMRHYDFADVLAASDDRDELDLFRDELAGTIVIGSEVSTGAADVGPVPTDAELPLSSLHANAIHTILTGEFLSEARGGTMLAIEILLLVLVLVLSLRFSSLPFSVGTIVLLLCYLVGVAVVFLVAHVELNVLRPSMAVVFSLVAVMLYRYVNEEKQKEVLRRSFESYFPPSVVRRIMANPRLITAGGQKKELTILFSDIKSFTTHSAPLAADEIQRLLNEYFDAMVEIVFQHQGTVDKFIGDGLMVFFGDPEPQEDHALRCVRAAIDMQRKVRQLRTKWEEQGSMPLQIRIGINTGSVVVGNMGSARRLSYTVLGSPVNLAQRLESNAPVGGILVSRRTYDLVKDHVGTRPLGSIQVKGLQELIEVYEVLLDEATLSSEPAAPRPV